MVDLTATQQYQMQFVAHLRQPRKVAVPVGVDEQRTQVYEELLYNNVEGFLLTCFPITRQILGRKRWTKWVQRFFAEPVCHSPFFRDISPAFVEFVTQHPKTAKKLPAFLPHLLNYECLELKAEIAPDVEETQQRSTGDVLKNRPLVPPSSLLAHYPYPVTQVTPKWQPKKERAQFVLVYRAADDRVRTLEINAVSAHLFALLQSKRCSGLSAVKQLAEHLQQSSEDFQPHVRTLLEEWQKLGVLQGYWRK